MPRMFNLRDVFQLVVNGLDNGTLSEEQLVGQVHQTIGHIFAHTRDEFQAMFPESEKEFVREIALIGKEFAKQALGEMGDGLPVIHIARREIKGEDFASVIDHQMEFEPIKPAHRGFATLSQPGKHL